MLTIRRCSNRRSRLRAHVKPDQNGRLELSLPPDALAILRADSKDSVFFRVSSADGTFIAGDADLPDPASLPRNRLQTDAQYRGMPVRLVGYRTYAGNLGFTVTMGETTHKRDEMRSRILTSALATDGAVLGLILALIWFSVNRSLAPLRAIEDQISRRSANDLTPVAVGDVPAEIRGVVAALNRLFRLVSEGAVSQRRFLDNAAHQLRTPLTGIQAQLELMCDSEEDPDTPPTHVAHLGRRPAARLHDASAADAGSRRRICESALGVRRGRAHDHRGSP